MYDPQISHHVGCTLVALRIFLTQHGNELFKMQWILHFDGKWWWGVMFDISGANLRKCTGMLWDEMSQVINCAID